MSYTVKNYTEQGGEKTVIGGEIVIEGKITVADGGEVEGITPEEATTETAGIVKKAANQADSIAVDTATLVTDFNALLAKLKAAGLMADEVDEE